MEPAIKPRSPESTTGDLKDQTSSPDGRFVSTRLCWQCPHCNIERRVLVLEPYCMGLNPGVSYPSCV